LDKALNINMNRIAIIIPYFGKWPEWIDLYLYSCSMNPEIDWHLFTDCEPKQQSSNIIFHPTTFDDYCKGVSESLNIHFHPQNAYKLCDLKPFYGFIHADILARYEFWGYGDIDTIWGNIRAFYTDGLLRKYDVFSTHADRLSGHLAILRNNKQLIESCFKIKDWQTKLENKSNFALDENDFSNLLYPVSKYIRKFYGKVVCCIFNWRDAWVIYYNMMPVLNWLFRIRQRRLYFIEQHTTPILSDDGRTCKHDADTWYYKNGVISNNKTKQKYMYLHFMIYKKNVFRKEYFWKENFYKIRNEYSNSEVLINKQGIQN
jgi:hypothetical protein